MARNYTRKLLNKDMQFIELESRRHPSKLEANSGTLDVKIRIPYNPNNTDLFDQPERVIKAFLDGHYEIERQERE